MSGAISAGTIISAVGAGASLLGAIGAFGGKKDSGAGALSTVLSQAAPATTAPTAMPAPNDAAVQAAQRRRIVEQQTRMGRSSTILSGGGLLGDNNPGEKLGA